MTHYEAVKEEEEKKEKIVINLLEGGKHETHKKVFTLQQH